MSSATDVSYRVPLIPQPTDVSCWAACAAMLLSWKRQERVHPRDLFERSRLNATLNWNDVGTYERLGFAVERALTCRESGAFVKLMRKHGPVMVDYVNSRDASGKPTGSHLVVVDAVQNGVARIKDPLPVTKGREYWVSLTNVLRALDQNADKAAAYYTRDIVYLK
ncbi:MAG: papain-like cysteine protease family protein [Steroidobacter sp.]